MCSLTKILSDGTALQMQSLVDAGFIPLIIKELSRVGFEAFTYCLLINVVS